MTTSEARLDFEGMIVTADQTHEDAQPWSGEPAFAYTVRISAKDAGEYATTAYGSQHDYENGRNDRAEEMAWMILHDLLSAYDDPEEFWTLAISEPDTVTIERARGVLSVIEYAEKIGHILEREREAITEAYERF